MQCRHFLTRRRLSTQTRCSWRSRMTLYHLLIHHVIWLWWESPRGATVAPATGCTTTCGIPYISHGAEWVESTDITRWRWCATYLRWWLHAVAPANSSVDVLQCVSDRCSTVAPDRRGQGCPCRSDTGSDTQCLPATGGWLYIDKQNISGWSLSLFQEVHR